MFWTERYGNLCTWKNWKRESDGAAIVLTQTDAKPPFLCQGGVTINGIPYDKFGMFDNITPNHRPDGVMEVTSVADWDLWSMDKKYTINTTGPVTWKQAFSQKDNYQTWSQFGNSQYPSFGLSL